MATSLNAVLSRARRVQVKTASQVCRVSRRQCMMTPKEEAMPVHHWKGVEAGIFHAFHHGWIEEISRSLNRGLLPPDYYALPEQIAGGLGPDVLTLRQPV